MQASWDEPTQTLVLHHGAEPTYLQSITLQLSDKVSRTMGENYSIVFVFTRVVNKTDKSENYNQNYVKLRNFRKA